MKRIQCTLKCFSLLLCAVLCSCFVLAAPPANYEGFGADTRGALADPNGYTTYHVTNLNESGEGSLRDALLAGSRLVVFDVGGTITLTSTLSITYSYITIDGSTAPDPGITIALTPAPPTVSFQIYSRYRDITDVIIRYIRLNGQADFHPDTGGGDILAICADYPPYKIENVVIDHVTAKKGQDGVFDTRWDVCNMTISNCFIYDTMLPTIMNGDARTSGPGLNRITMHHNVYARCDGRQPLLQRTVNNFDFVNNVIYGWGYWGAGDHGASICYDAGLENPDCEFTKNYYKATDAPWNGPHDALLFQNYNGADRGNITFTENIFPPEEDEDTSYGTPTVIPEAYRPTEYDADTLGDTVVPFVGMQYPTDEEIALLNEISLAIGGQGTPPEPPDQPEPPQPPEPPVEPETIPTTTEMHCCNNVLDPSKGEEALIHVALDRQAQVTVVIYDSTGKEVKKIMDGEEQPGIYPIAWDGTDGSHNTVGSGIYMVHMKSGGFTTTKKIVVVK